MKVEKKKKNKRLENHGYTGLPRDRASGWMLILKEILQFPCDCGTCANCQWDVYPSLYSTIEKLVFEELLVQPSDVQI